MILTTPRKYANILRFRWKTEEKLQDANLLGHGHKDGRQSVLFAVTEIATWIGIFGFIK
jgi:hypothetical protein